MVPGGGKHIRQLRLLHARSGTATAPLRRWSGAAPARRGQATGRIRFEMGPLLAFSRGVDRLNAAVGKLADWAVLLACGISAGNAFVRYGISYSSNAWL